VAAYRIYLAGIAEPLQVESDTPPSFTAAEWVTVGRVSIRSAAVQAVEEMPPEKQNPGLGYTGTSYSSV
jgi:hypothetical protein